LRVEARLQAQAPPDAAVAARGPARDDWGGWYQRRRQSGQRASFGFTSLPPATTSKKFFEQSQSCLFSGPLAELREQLSAAVNDTENVTDMIINKNHG
jgi:hypothetical protein